MRLCAERIPQTINKALGQMQSGICIFVRMPKAILHISTTKHILLLCFVLLSLTPCNVKEILATGLNVEYAKPLNKSKTTAPVNSCQYTKQTDYQISVGEQSVVSIRKYHFSKLTTHDYTPTLATSGFSKNFSGNSPPKYILYKRLKVDIA